MVYAVINCTNTLFQKSVLQRGKVNTAPAGVMGVISRFSWMFQCRTCWLAFLSLSWTSWKQKLCRHPHQCCFRRALNKMLLTKPVKTNLFTSRRWWLLWRDACRSWSSWEAELRAEGVSSSGLPSDSSCMGLRFCIVRCCSWRSWKCFLFSSSACSNLKEGKKGRSNWKC